MKTFKQLLVWAVICGLSMAVTRADYLTWDGSAGDYLWDGTSGNWNDGVTGSLPWDNNYAAKFAGDDGATVNITIGDGVGLTKVKTDDNRVMMFQGGNDYVFGGATLNVLPVDDAGGDHNFRVELSGGHGVTFNNYIDSTGVKMRLHADNGSYITLNAGLTTGDKELQIGWFGNGTVNFSGGNFTLGQLMRTSEFNIIGTANLYATGGHNGSNGVTTVNGGTVSFGGDVNNNTFGVSNNSGSFLLLAGEATFRNDGISILKANNTGANIATLEVRDGTLTSLGDKGLVLVNADATGGNGSAVYLQSGGTVVVKGLKFAHKANELAATVTASATLSDGLLLISSEGVKKNNDNSTLTDAQISFTASGGTIGALADWSSDVKMSLTGNVTFQASGTAGDAHNITLNAGLSGNGGFTKTGDGTLLLAAANSYSGNTVVNAGVLVAGVEGSLGTSDVSVLSGGKLQLNAALSLGDLSLATGSFVELNFSNSDVALLGSLLYDGGLISLNAGYNYSAAELNYMLGIVNVFSGDGLLSVSAIPEPSTYALLVFGFLGVMALRLANRMKAGE
jgi:autotransporter-associated beta strand protein